MSDFNIKAMQKAIQLSRDNMLDGYGGPFGAVITKDNKIIAEGYNEVTSCNDPTAHAEVQAIRKACQIVGNFNLEGYEIYTSCEPCPMCLSAIYWARLDKIFYANSRKDAAAIDFDDDFIYDEIPKEMNERSIKMIRLLGNEAKLVFGEWAEKNDKIKY